MTTSVAAARRSIRAAQRAHGHAPSFGRTFQDIYVLAFSAVVLSLMAGGLLDSFRRASSNGCSTVSCHAAQNVFPLVTILAAGGVVLLAAVAVGPLFLDPATDYWLASSPVSRAQLLRLPLLRALVPPSIAVAFVEALTAIEFMPPGDAVRLGIVTGAGTPGLVALAVLTQTSMSPRATRALKLAGRLMLAGAAGAAAAALAWPAAFSRYSQLNRHTLLIALLPVAACSLVGAGFAVGRLGRIRRGQLSSGWGMVQGIKGAAVGLDLALVGDVFRARSYRQRQARPSRRGLGRGPWAVALRASTSAFGSVQTYFALGLGLILVALIGHFSHGTLTFGPVSIIGFVLAFAASPTARVLYTSPRLRRATGLTDSQLAAASSAPILLVSAIWGVVAAALLPIGPWWSVAVALASSSAAGSIRLASASRPDFGAPALASPMGPTPIVGIAGALRGIDAVVVVSLPVIAGAGPAVIVGVAVAVCWFAWFSATQRNGTAGLTMQKSPTPTEGSGKLDGTF